MYLRFVAFLNCYLHGECLWISLIFGNLFEFKFQGNCLTLCGLGGFWREIQMFNPARRPDIGKREDSTVLS